VAISVTLSSFEYSSESLSNSEIKIIHGLARREPCCTAALRSSQASITLKVSPCFLRPCEPLVKALKRSCALSPAVILVDSGPLVAAGSTQDSRHEVCTELLGSVCTELLGSATEELLVPATVSAEVCYMPETRAGSRSEAALLRLFSVGKLVPVDTMTADCGRMAELVEQYAD
jgi:predicted nucleic acid-binding protein